MVSPTRAAFPSHSCRSYSSREAANEIYGKSLVYQEVDGARKLVAANYVLRSKDCVGTQKSLTAIEL